MNYPDSVIIVDPVIDEYGTEKIGRMETVACIYAPATGYTQGSNQAQINSDATLYLDPTDDYVLEVHKRLEGMLVIASEGESQTDGWYRISVVNVGKRSLLDNTLDNVQVDLTKSSPIESVS
jgi:hypothetical protein